MRKGIVLSVIVIAVFISGCTTGEGYYRRDYNFTGISKIAVIDVVGPLESDAMRNQVGDFFVMELIKRGYVPIERAQVQSLLKEQDFQSSEMTSNNDVAQAGEILNVPVVMIININELDEDVQMSAKMVDVQDGSILWQSIGKGKTGKFASTLIGAAAGAVAGAAVTGDSDKTVGTVAGGVLGGAAGNLLAPDIAEKVQEVAGKMCESMPSKMIQYEKKGFLGL